MKLTGEAFKDTNYSLNDQVVLLGITNWHTIRGKDSLLVTEKKGQFNEYDLTARKLTPLENSEHLNPYHSHFLLADSGKVNEFGEEIKFRTQIEKALTKYKVASEADETKPSSNTKTINAVVLVLGGGRHTLRHVLESIKNDISCIFFEVYLDATPIPNIFKLKRF